MGIKNTNPDLRPGDIVIANLNNNTNSYIIQKPRPCIVVSNVVATRISPIIHVVPLTRKIKNLPTHLPYTRKNEPQTILCEQLTSVPRDQITQTGEWVDLTTLNKIKEKIALALDIKTL